jgi:hypothetical protein
MTRTHRSPRQTLALRARRSLSLRARPVLEASLLSIAGAALLAACANPAVDARIEALGEEPLPDLADFQYHRAGQPCVLCHGEYEEEEPIMSIGGTIYQKAGSLLPADRVTVLVWDSSGDANLPRSAVTNCVGNFFFTKEEFNPVFPLHVEVSYEVVGSDDPRKQPMATRIGREGSCAGCHSEPPSELGSVTQASPGHVFASPNADTEFPPIAADCPVPPPTEAL